MTVREYKTNLKCGSCVATIAPRLNAEPSIRKWSVDLDDPRKTLTVEGDQVSDDVVASLLTASGYQVLGSGDSSRPEHKSESFQWQTYYPLLLVGVFLIGFVAYLEWLAGTFVGMRAMQRFMGGFFVVFAFFKLLDVRGFADAFQTYDIAARRFPLYAVAYPWIELALGVAYLTNVAPLATNIATLIVMTLGLAGVTQALLAKRRIQCACLGTVFKLPMSKVTFVEDFSMAAMALIALTPIPM
jgi:copper chaperone CopZ